MRLIPVSWIINRSLKELDNLQFGSLRLVTPEGKLIHAKGKEPGPDAQWTIRDWDVVIGLLERGDIAWGEDYIAGKWESESIETLLTFFLVNFDRFERFAHGNWLSRLGFTFYNCFVRRNSKKGSRRNIEAHYDVGNDFYKLWLDGSMTYSSALFASNDNSLEEAQAAKYQRILQRIGTDASSILEIGCGWGGFAEAASKNIPRVTGLTISPSQHRYASERLGDRADMRLQDYRDVRGPFDAIVSIEMFEAVGEKYWPTYFKAIADNLKRGGKAVIQTITMRDDCFDEYRKRSDFIRHYVFPGGMLPSMKTFTDEAAKAGLKCLDAFSFGQDYARTLREWLARFEEKRPDILQLGYNEAFIRNWRFYLSICAAAFAVERTNVVQVELAHA